MTTNRDAGARLLRQLRERRGWSWTDLARALRDTARHLAVTSLADRQIASIQRTVARWESLGELTSPGERYQVLLAHLYARTPSGDLSLGPGSDFEALLDALRHFGTTPQRIEQLVEHVARTAGGGDLLTQLSAPVQYTALMAQRDPSRPDIELLNHLQDRIDAINRQVGSTPFVRLQLQLGPIVEYCHRLLPQACADVDHGLRFLATNAYALAARLAFETRDDEVALELYAQATQAATALERAWKTVDQLTIDDPHGGFNVDRLHGFDGLCALHTGDPHRAHRALDNALNGLTTTRDAVQRGIVGTDLAMAHLRLGDPRTSAELLHDAIDITATTGGRVAAQRIRTARHNLRPWRTENFIAELDDHIHDALVGH